MAEILQATYTNGNLVFGKRLDPALEGKRVRVTILDTEIDEQVTGKQTHQTDESAEPEPGATRSRAFLRLARYAVSKHPERLSQPGDRETVQTIPV